MRTHSRRARPARGVVLTSCDHTTRGHPLTHPQEPALLQRKMSSELRMTRGVSSSLCPPGARLGIFASLVARSCRHRSGVCHGAACSHAHCRYRPACGAGFVAVRAGRALAAPWPHRAPRFPRHRRFFAALIGAALSPRESQRRQRALALGRARPGVGSRPHGVARALFQ